MNLASFYLSLFMNHSIKRFGQATLKCDMLGKEDNYKYLVALSIFWEIYDMKLKFLFILGYFM